MIKNFKKFNLISEKLTDVLDDDFIENYYDENLKNTDIVDILGLYPKLIWKFIDDDEYVKDHIESEINNAEFEEFDIDNYIEFITNNMDDDFESEIINVYNSKNKKRSDDIDYMLNKLKKKDLINIIENLDKEEDCIRYIMEKRYKNYDAEDIWKEYGDLDSMRASDIYNTFRYYIDEEGIIDDYNENQDKQEELENNICNEIELQRKILEVAPEKVLKLAKIFKNEHGKNISDEYDFQKTFINEYVNKNCGNECEENERGEYIAKALKYLYDNFDLDYDIKDEYKDYMWLVFTSKFNL